MQRLAPRTITITIVRPLARVTLPLCCPSNYEADDNYLHSEESSVVSAGAEQIRCEDVTTQD